MQETAIPRTKPVKVWDIYTRLFHWSLGLAIAVSFISVDQGEMEIHVVSGIAVLGLIVFRLIWGLVGSSTAQFHRFIRGPKAIIAYLRNSNAPQFKPMIGHNPLGALSVVALLTFAGVQAVTGLFATDDIYTEGPLEKFVSSDFSRWATSVHDTNSDLLLIMIGLHVAAVFYYLIMKGQDLIGPMVLGEKRVPAEEAGRARSMKGRNPIFAGAAIAAAAALAYYIYEI